MGEDVPAIIAIGSNIDPHQNLPEAIRALERHPEIDLKAVSRTYVTAPAGGRGDQPAFHNAAAIVETDLTPEALRAALRGIEAALGRERTDDPNASRTIDLDIGFYDRRLIVLDSREIPEEDAFTHVHLVVPMAEVAPDWWDPRRELTLAQAAAAVSTDAPLVIAPRGRTASYTTEGRYAVELEAEPGEVYAPHFEALVENMLVEVGENPSREGLVNTPLRVAK
ncbi:MAG: 2-amino-4-hydroxy-6-hydroxymethyldihydropteridine diphosphokinase, partial [Acidimicrobiia bacterium]